jgi:pseudouridine-5'-phosphate glycosidase
MPPSVVKVSERVEKAVAEGRPVVALESSIIARDIPRPRNLQAAHDFESMLTDAGVTPATIAVVDGVPTVGLNDEELERLALTDQFVKVSSRDLAVAVGRKACGATTVAATATLAALAGIRIFATGGLGGVGRTTSDPFDESADLVTLSRTRVTVVCGGVKSILDIAATLERLETLNVPVVGYRTNQFPAFYLSDSGFGLEWRVDSADEVATIMQAGDQLGARSALIVANPVRRDQQLDPDVHDRLLIQAMQAADEAGVHGKAISPFVLDYFQRESGGRSLQVNLDLSTNNVALAGQLAIAWAEREARNRWALGQE